LTQLTFLETHVYLGTVDGRIIMYEFRIEKNGIVWKEIEETFIKKKAPIIKMACWADKGLLITLSNNSIQFWTPTDLQEKPGIPGLPEKVLIHIIHLLLIHITHSYYNIRIIHITIYYSFILLIHIKL
jgi:hypothetical protein